MQSSEKKSPPQAKGVCKARHTKRPPRRSKAAIEALCGEIYDIIDAYNPMTVRQVFYQLVTRDLIGKTESEYKNTVCRLLAKMRRDGALPYHWISDNTRWMRKPRTFSSVEQMLRVSKRTYRQAIWDNQEDYVEIWLEKEALAGVLCEVTEEWDVALMVTRGYPSLTFLHTAAEVIAAKEKPAHLYYFGDHDPSGVDIDRFVEESIRRIAGDGIELTFKRVAILPEQIQQYGLQTRPTKKTDSRSKNFEGESVEVDAIDPHSLRELCTDCIEQHIDEAAFKRMLLVEQGERETLQHVINSMSA
jgi:hypothetical protein